MKTSWEATESGLRHYVSIGPSEVVVGSGSGHSDNARACSHGEFLAGRHHDVVARVFGPAGLEEIASAVRSAASYAPFRTEQDRHAAIHAFLDTLPIDDTLAALVDHPETENGRRNAQRIESDSAVFAVGDGELHGTLTRKDGGAPPRRVELDHYVSGIVAVDDRLYISYSGGGWAVLGPDGRKVDGGGRDSPLWQGELRVKGVYRHGRRVIFPYALNLAPDYATGLLAYEPGRGFVGRFTT